MKMSFMKRVNLCTLSPKQPCHPKCFSKCGLCGLSFFYLLQLLIFTFICYDFSFSLCCIFIFATDFNFSWTFVAYSFVCQQLRTRRVEWATSPASVERKRVELIRRLTLVTSLFLCFEFDLIYSSVSRGHLFFPVLYFKKCWFCFNFLLTPYK